MEFNIWIFMFFIDQSLWNQVGPDEISLDEDCDEAAIEVDSATVADIIDTEKVDNDENQTI